MTRKVNNGVRKVFRNLKAFSLVELIIVIAIVAILSVAGFLTLQKRISQSRDSKRLGDLETIEKSLTVNYADSSSSELYPTPDNAEEITGDDGETTWYQGYFGSGAVEEVSSLSKKPQDPLWTGYEYSVTADQSAFEVYAELENEKKLSYINRVYADEEGTIVKRGNYNGYLISTNGSDYNLYNTPSIYMYSGSSLASGEANYVYQEGEKVGITSVVSGVNITELKDEDESNDSAAYEKIKDSFGLETVEEAKTVVSKARGGKKLSGEETTKITRTESTEEDWLDNYENNLMVTGGDLKLRKNSSYSLDFDGDDDYVSLGDWAFFDGQKSFSISTWIKTDMLSYSDDGHRNDHAQILGKQGNTSDDNVLLGILNDGKIGFYADTTNNDNYSIQTGSINENDWYHIVATYGDGNMRLYINGEKIISKSVSDSLVSNSNYFDIGGCGQGNFGGSNFWFDGNIDQIYFYDRILSASEVEEIYGGSVLGDEIASYPIDKGDGDTIYDSSNSNNGIINGATWSEDTPFRYYSEGYRVSNPLSLDKIKNLEISKINRDSEESTNTNITVQVAVNEDSTTRPTSWTEVTNGGNLPVIDEGDDLSGKYLWIKQEMSTEDSSQTPKLHKLNLEVTGTK